MRLKIQPAERRKRLSFLIRSSVMDDLHSYKAFASEELEQSTDVGTIVEKILEQFMASDKDFRAYKKAAEDDKKAKSTSASQTDSGSDRNRESGDSASTSGGTTTNDTTSKPSSAGTQSDDKAKGGGLTGSLGRRLSGS